MPLVVAKEPGIEQTEFSWKQREDVVFGLVSILTNREEVTWNGTP